MRQTILSVTLEAKPQSIAPLTAIIDAILARARLKGPDKPDFGWFMTAVPSVHFLSMNVFPAADYDPVFVLEANFDGAPGAFWAELEAVLGDDLRAILRCCKQPLDKDGPLFAAITAAGSREPLAAYFERRAAVPSVGHQGNRGMTRNRILQERDLFLATRQALPAAGPGTVPLAPTATPVEVHAQLRAALLRDRAWLAEKPATRISFGERVLDWTRLIAFVLLLLVLLATPGWLWLLAEMLGRFVHWRNAVAACFDKPGADTAQQVACMAGLARPAMSGIHVAIVAVLGIVVSGAILAAWLRYLEQRDSPHDAPSIDPELLRQMAALEDRIPQNHMGSIVMLKPGTLRTIIVHAGHHALHLALRATATEGYLGSMRTVHFAHWAFVNNAGRLMFFSNFDHSWESYLDDFIEKAHGGLTLAWGCGVGFPPTRWLVGDGASYGTRFKQWARHSMVVARFWYSAYPDLTVDQIERNNRIANGLRKPRLSAAEAANWIEDL